MSKAPDLSDHETLWISEQRFRTIFETAFQFIGFLKPDGTLLEANRAPLQSYGLTRSEVVGRLFWETPWWIGSR